ncbi:glutathione S-transferase family protein [Rheinheimera sp. 1928-s]|uniref:glutathione S-transferase family protein n=1 Tax=Rheinheimera sp. 1928-s TaxID=3033803 RepID=UPI00260A3C0C|nr:glutathione S-transferase family protein [Rheinheimera sp. 1928-s]MDF3125340.1 glutathione S-transferase family protein [Rheinheimera sp. 1928-s]
MQLLSSDFSPYSTRVRIQIRKKQLLISIAAPVNPALRTPEFGDKYPLGKIPVLVLDDGNSLSESWAIMEYLEASFPQISLRPADALGIAHINMLARYADLHLSPALFPIFIALLSSKTIDTQQEITRLQQELQKGERLLTALPPFRQRKLTIGDIALATNLFFAIETPRLFGCEQILQPYPLLSDWWQWVNEDAEIRQGIAEMNTALQGFIASKQG